MTDDTQFKGYNYFSEDEGESVVAVPSSFSASLEGGEEIVDYPLSHDNFKINGLSPVAVYVTEYSLSFLVDGLLEKYNELADKSETTKGIEVRIDQDGISSFENNTTNNGQLYSNFDEVIFNPFTSNSAIEGSTYHATRKFTGERLLFPKLTKPSHKIQIDKRENNLTAEYNFTFKYIAFFDKKDLLKS